MGQDGSDQHQRYKKNRPDDVSSGFSQFLDEFRELMEFKFLSNLLASNSPRFSMRLAIRSMLTTVSCNCFTSGWTTLLITSTETPAASALWKGCDSCIVFVSGSTHLRLIRTKEVRKMYQHNITIILKWKSKMWSQHINQLRQMDTFAWDIDINHVNWRSAQMKCTNHVENEKVRTGRS